MARPYKYAWLICLILTILVVIGVILGFLLSNPLPVLISLLPLGGYEAYRTMGETTRWASWVLVLVLVVEIVLVIGGISFDLSALLGEEEKMVAGYYVPLGDIRVVGPTIMAVLSLILLVRTRGIYTRWMAVVIFLTCFVVVYTLDSTYFSRLLHVSAEKGSEMIQ